MRSFVLATCAVLACGAPARASRIALETTPGAGYADGKVTVAVTIANRGDEAARNVRLSASLGDRAAQGETLGNVEAGETRAASVRLDGTPSPAGIHVVVVRVHYTDASGHPFTALRAVSLMTAMPDDPADPIQATLDDATIGRTASLALKLRNATGAPKTARVRLALPTEIETIEAARDVTLGPYAEATLRFEARNLAALAGSEYGVVAVVDALDGQGLHRGAVAMARLKVTGALPRLFTHHALCGVLTAALVAVFLALQFAPAACVGAWRAAYAPRVRLWWFDAAVLAGVYGFVLYHVPPWLVLSNTTLVGGDTPAHNYLVSHLGEQLAGRGRVLSWANGWWCGFPMFQYYFCLPYLWAAALDLVLPFNVAMKLASVTGLFLLPGAAFVAARTMRLPRPGPALGALAAVLLLFDRSHTMWGVNIYSTLAGMIANSLSFPLMLLAVASVSGDMDAGRFRPQSVALLAATVASHFFTSVMAGLVLAVVCLARHRAGLWRAARVLAAEGALAGLLMAWWLVPLVAKRDYAVDFGENWDVRLARDLPAFAWWLAPLAAAGVGLGLARRSRFVVAHAAMLLGGVLLFGFGYERVSAVFVNVRLWPFIVWGILGLAAAGLTWLVERMRAPALAVFAALVAALAWGVGSPNDARGWTRWNYEGLEKKAHAAVFRDLVLPLKGTPGRLANDLHEDNNLLGSSRIFELVPHLTGKPVLEGGLVNSAAGSMFSYYVQSETSRACAGFPPIVRPSTFDMATATRHLELFNVKHFIARWPRTQEALARHPDWVPRGERDGWRLYELMSHDGRHVFVPSHEPLAVRAADWKRAGLNWIYTTNALDQPFVVLDLTEAPSEAGRPAPRFGKPLTAEEYSGWLAAAPGARTNGAATVAWSTRILYESVESDRIRFRTTAPGAPHIVKVTHFPNWMSRGGERVYRVTPCFMLVYPVREEVDLYYGKTAADRLGLWLARVGWLTFAGLCVARFPVARRLWREARGGA